MPGGDKLYAYLVQSTTTTDMTPEQIHQLGLSEVARITKEFEKVRREVGFKGTLPQFFDYMRTSPKFQPKSREQLDAGLYRLQEKVEAKVPRFFSLVPKTAARIQPYPAFREKFEAGGCYEPGTPGRLAPRHLLLQRLRFAVAQHVGRNDPVPPRGRAGPPFPDQHRAGKCGAAVVHALRRQHRLCRGLGALFGNARLRHGLLQGPLRSASATLNDEMLRAMRLVVDTGIHAKGWTRDQSIAYMLSPLGHERRPTRPPRSSATSPFRARRRPTRSGADDPAAAREGEGRARARSSTSANSTPRCWTPARCR